MYQIVVTVRFGGSSVGRAVKVIFRRPALAVWGRTIARRRVPFFAALFGQNPQRKDRSSGPPGRALE